MIVCDANILLELLEQRGKVDLVMKRLEQYAAAHETVAVSVLTASHLFYLAEAHKLPIESAEGLLARFKLLDVTNEDIAWALSHYQGKDFEDGLQISVALRCGASAFLTLDGPLSRKYAAELPIELIK